ncbi:MAG: glycosyltransferase [Bacteroidota bacterium]
MFSDTGPYVALEFTFWISLGLVLYTYLGYPVILGILVFVRKTFNPRKTSSYSDDEFPEVTVLVACYNEADILEQKIQNTAQLDYPVDKRFYWFVTDGSTDNSPDIIRKHAGFEVFHEKGRKGKNAAVNRVMNMVKTPIVVFCDANTILNKEALKLLVRHFKDPKVGAVAGEKTSDAGRFRKRRRLWRRSLLEVRVITEKMGFAVRHRRWRRRRIACRPIRIL